MSLGEPGEHVLKVSNHEAGATHLQRISATHGSEPPAGQSLNPMVQAGATSLALAGWRGGVPTAEPDGRPGRGASARSAPII